MHPSFEAGGGNTILAQHEKFHKAASLLPSISIIRKKRFPFPEKPFEWVPVRILRNCLFIGLASLLFLSCDKNKKADVSPQVADPAMPQEQSVAFLKLQAEEGIRDAQFKYAYYLASGHGVAQDFATARHWFSKAAEQGHSEAQFRLGFLLLQGREDEIPKPSEAAEWFLKAANNGHVEAQFTLGRQCLEGRGVVKDSTKALAWFELAARQDHAPSQFQIGRMHENGTSTPQDPAAAYSWFEKAARQGNAAAQYKTGLMSRDGIGTAADKARADHWFGLAEAQGLPRPAGPPANKDGNAEAGPAGPAGPLPKAHSRPKHSPAVQPAAEPPAASRAPSARQSTKPQQEFLKSPDPATQFQKEQEKKQSDIANVEYQIAENFAEGDTIAPDPQKAREYYLRSAKKGHAESLFKLGMEYLAPPGAEAPDPANAIVWLERAAAQGHAESQHQLGEIYHGGMLGPPDFKKAYWWHWLAASNNQHPDSQNRIGEMYLYGQGVEKSADTAAAWFEKAAAQGQEASAQHLRSLRQAVQAAVARETAARSPPTLSPAAWLEKGLRLYRAQPTADNFREAYQCFSNAALGGKKEAHYYIGLMLDYGQGIQSNPEKAFENYLVAARDGYARAQFNLGFLYESGRGTRKLLSEAYVWYTLAGGSGMGNAVRTRNELARKMKPYEVAYAQQRLGMLKKLLAGE